MPVNAASICAYHRLEALRLLPEAEAHTACISVRDFRKLKALVKKATSDCVSLNGTGFLFLSGNIAGGRLLVRWLGSGLAFALPGAHVWRITLNGNVRQTSPVLYNWLKENGIYLWHAKIGGGR